MRVLIAPVEISGYYVNLHKGLTSLGISCDYAMFEEHPFGYSSSKKHPNFLLRSIYYIRRKLILPNVHRSIRSLALCLCFFLQFLFALYAIFSYDLFIFGYGQTLLPLNLDLYLLKILRKITICNLGHGSEVRPPFLDGSSVLPSGAHRGLQYLQRETLTRKSKCLRIQSLAAFTIGSPMSTHYFADRPFVNWFEIGVPCQYPHASSNSNPLGDNSVLMPVKILHAPSHPYLKGTKLIRQAINNLMSKGFSIEYVELLGKPNCDVLDAIAQCDFVVDQVYSDTPLAGLASEAAWYGKPSVVGGYGLLGLKESISSDMWPPSFACHPDDIETSIQILITDRALRLDLGARARAFVRNQWSSAAVARRYLQLFFHNAPQTWLINPSQVKYALGCGQSIASTAETIRIYVDTYGIQALGLSRHVNVQSALLNLRHVDVLRDDGEAQY